MTAPDNPDPADFADDDEAAINMELEALTGAGSLLATADDPDEDVGEDPVGELFDEADEDGIGVAGVPDDDAADEMFGLADADGGHFTAETGAPIDSEEPGLEEEDEEFVSPSAMVGFAVAAPSADSDRVDRLEDVARALMAAEVDREGGRVRRKVSASATGAATVGGIPVLLQLVGALHLSPELAATATAVAASLASLLAGYLTPERKPVLPPAVVHEVQRHPKRRGHRRH